MKKGDIVFNKVFGVGVIVNINPDYACIKFNSLKTFRNIKTGYFEKR